MADAGRGRRSRVIEPGDAMGSVSLHVEFVTRDVCDRVSGCESSDCGASPAGTRRNRPLLHKPKCSSLLRGGTVAACTHYPCAHAQHRQSLLHKMRVSHITRSRGAQHRPHSSGSRAKIASLHLYPHPTSLVAAKTTAAGARRRGSVAAHAAAAPAPTAARRYDRLLSFASDGIEPVHVAVKQLPGPNGGRGLVAEADVPAGGVLLSVPFSRVFTSQPAAALRMHWAAEMGMRLLQERHACSQAGAASDAGSGSKGGGGWCPWVAVLPQRVVTPLEFTEEEAAQCGVPATVRVRRRLSRGLDWGAVRGALSGAQMNCAIARVLNRIHSFTMRQARRFDTQQRNSNSQHHTATQTNHLATGHPQHASHAARLLPGAAAQLGGYRLRLGRPAVGGAGAALALLH